MANFFEMKGRSTYVTLAGLTLLLTTSTTFGYSVLIGPGGCDVSASNCTPATGADASSILQFEWSGDAQDEMKRVNSYNTHGKPTWIHASESCVFATLSDINTIVSYQIGENTLKLMSNVSSEGISPVFLDNINDVLIVANYHGPDDGKDATGATAATLKINQDCSLSKGDSIPVTGHSINPSRQGTSHVHSVVANPHLTNATHGVFLACDLGGDAVYTFAVNLQTAMLTELHKSSVTPGSGPRHTAIHPKKQFAYIIHEMMNFVSVHSIDDTGFLTKVQEVPTLSKDCLSPVFSKAAEIIITPDGMSVFASNRGYGGDCTNTLAGYKVLESGLLEPVGFTQSKTEYPRGMELAVNKKQLLVEGESTNNMVVFDITGPGELTMAGEVIKSGLPNPTTLVCL